MPKKYRAHEQFLNYIGTILDFEFKHLYGKKMCFFISVWEFGVEGISDYISNGERESMIKALRKTADRLEKNQIIPKTIGEA